MIKRYPIMDPRLDWLICRYPGDRGCTAFLALWDAQEHGEAWLLARPYSNSTETVSDVSKQAFSTGLQCPPDAHAFFIHRVEVLLSRAETRKNPQPWHDSDFIGKACETLRDPIDFLRQPAEWRSIQEQAQGEFTEYQVLFLKRFDDGYDLTVAELSRGVWDDFQSLDEVTPEICLHSAKEIEEFWTIEVPLQAFEAAYMNAVRLSLKGK